MKVCRAVQHSLDRIICDAKNNGDMHQATADGYKRFVEEFRIMEYDTRGLCGFSRERNFFGMPRFNEDFQNMYLTSISGKEKIEFKFEDADGKFEYGVPFSLNNFKFVRFSFAKNSEGLYIVQRKLGRNEKWIDDREIIIVPD